MIVDRILSTNPNSQSWQELKDNFGRPGSRSACGHTPSHGDWCLNCINQAFPCAEVRSHYWIALKGARQVDNNLYIGPYGGPLEIGKVSVPLSPANWCLSCLQVLAELDPVSQARGNIGYWVAGTERLKKIHPDVRILCGLIRISQSRLTREQFVLTVSPALAILNKIINHNAMIL